MQIQLRYILLIEEAFRRINGDVPSVFQLDAASVRPQDNYAGYDRLTVCRAGKGISDGGQVGRPVGSVTGSEDHVTEEAMFCPVTFCLVRPALQSRSAYNDSVQRQY